MAQEPLHNVGGVGVLAQLQHVLHHVVPVLVLDQRQGMLRNLTDELFLYRGVSTHTATQQGRKGYLLLRGRVVDAAL